MALYNDLSSISKCNTEEMCDIRNKILNNIAECKVYTINNLNALFLKHPDQLTIIHCNMRSLTKNKHKLEEILTKMTIQPTFILISETKINVLQAPFNVNIDGYKFYHSDSTTNAGGVGIYVKDYISITLRNDLHINTVNQCEDLWLEASYTGSRKPIILGVIYRHPNNNFKDFEIAIVKRLDNLQQLNYTYYIGGDININVGELYSPKIKNYINVIHSTGCNFAINKPTRYSPHSKPSILDHFYTRASNSQV